MFVILFTPGLLVSSCGRDAPDARFSFVDRGRETPDFSAEMAYDFIGSQVAFGPRNPGSEGHRLCRDFLAATLRQYAGDHAVYLQSFQHTGYGEVQYDMYNIIASFQPEMRDRIMLLAHWDTRPRAERDPDLARRDDPIAGADDGGSGVGVLLEMARIFSEHPPPIGVDIILFDGEDYGHEGDIDSYFLGSRYWAENPPVPGYRPRFGVLLDMVGANDAVFPREGFSMKFASQLVDEVWTIAAEMGYDTLFLDTKGSSIADDHWIINYWTDIPTINIIHHKPPRPMQSDVTFPDYWHTHADDMEIIGKETLQAVGNVLVELVYNRLR